jgi:raffinose/stachyose/melibiose transport system permease protein
VKRASVLVGLGAALVLFLAPFVVIALNAVKSPADYATHGPLSLPHGLHLGGIVDFWNRVDFTRKLLNSLVVSGAVALLGVGLSVFNAYALGIGRIKGRVWFLVFFLVANLLPQEVLVYPLYYLSKSIGLYDNLLSVIIIFTVIQSAFGTYLLSSVFGEFPTELLDAAAVDGAGRWRTLWRIVVPVSRPTLAVLCTFFFIWTWNEFLLPLVFLVSNDQQTVPGGTRRAAGRPHDGRHHDQRVGTHRDPARRRVLPDLPAHPDPRHHRRSDQVTAATTERHVQR